MKPYHFGHYVNVLGRIIVKRMNEKMSNTGLTCSQWSVIARLLREDELTQTEICEQLSIEAPAISKTICNMVSAGWLTRLVNESDKREKKVALTEKAKEYLPTWLRSINDLETTALNGIESEEAEIFNRVLKRMIVNLRKEH
jgi:MarR family transcriptional regulator for hemolysin